MGNFLYHGKDRKYCYYRPMCLICILRTFFGLIRLVNRMNREACT